MQAVDAVVHAASPAAASEAFFAAAQPYGASYLQTRVYRRPAGVLTPAAHLHAGGVISRIAPSGWRAGNPAFDYVCLTRNPLVDAIRQGRTTYRFSEFAPPGTREFGAYWEAMREARIGDAICATAYGRCRKVASLHLGFQDPDLDPQLQATLSLAGTILVETLMRFEASDGEPAAACLTRRERDSLEFVAQGKTDWEIATILGVSETTARFHVDNARRKLGASNRVHAVALFMTGSGLH